MIRGFNNAAKGIPFLVLADLERASCAPEVVNEWLPAGPNPNLILRFAVREVEAWLLADREALADFLGVHIAIVPINVEQLDDPKRELVNIARRSSRSDIRRDIVPRTGSSAVVGRGYNARLQHFVVAAWRPDIARNNANSLARTLAALSIFTPSWAVPAPAP
jgi:hypothetical protein